MQAWDGTSMVETSVWTVQISDVPVNMTEVYPTQGPLRCYRMLQMGLDMPFGCSRHLTPPLSPDPSNPTCHPTPPTRCHPTPCIICPT